MAQRGRAGLRGGVCGQAEPQPLTLAFAPAGNKERGWNDPPQFSYGLQAQGAGPRRAPLTRRVPAPGALPGQHPPGPAKPRETPGAGAGAGALALRVWGRWDRDGLRDHTLCPPCPMRGAGWRAEALLPAVAAAPRARWCWHCTSNPMGQPGPGQPGGDGARWWWWAKVPFPLWHVLWGGTMAFRCTWLAPLLSGLWS